MKTVIQTRTFQTSSNNFCFWKKRKREREREGLCSLCWTQLVIFSEMKYFSSLTR